MSNGMKVCCTVTGCDQPAEVSASWLVTARLAKNITDIDNPYDGLTRFITKPFIDSATGNIMSRQTAMLCGSHVSDLWDRMAPHTKDTFMIEGV